MGGGVTRSKPAPAEEDRGHREGTRGVEDGAMLNTGLSVLLIKGKLRTRVPKDETNRGEEKGTEVKEEGTRRCARGIQKRLLRRKRKRTRQTGWGPEKILWRSRP